MAVITIFQTLFPAVLGFFLIKKSIIQQQGLDAINKLVIYIILPVFIFVQLVERFDFSSYKNWWVFPILSFVITIIGLFLGWIFLKLSAPGFSKKLDKKEFLSLMAFQNAGYLPLVLAGNILPLNLAKQMYILIFLFLIGFNITVWSLGVVLLRDKTDSKKEHFLLGIFSPPVLAVLSAFIVISLRLDALIPSAVISPLKSLGQCLPPLAMLVVGGNLAGIKLGKIINKKAIFYIILLKQIFLPCLALLILSKFRLGFLISLLILLETAMPPATSLSIISRNYREDETLISQGIFFGHLASIITIPLFLVLFWMVLA